MHHLSARSVVALLVLSQLAIPTSIIAQADSRPRRSQPADAQPPVEQWRTTPNPAVTLSDSAAPTSVAEPKIRVALATDVGSATISSSGQLMNATDAATTLVALDVQRVRLEPRMLSPLSADAEETFQLQITGLASRAEATQKSRELQEATGEDSQITNDTSTNTWGLMVGGKRNREAADAERTRLEDVGYAVAVVPVSGASSAATATNRTGNSPAGVLRPVSRPSNPSREVVAFAGNAGRLFSSGAPVTFASADATAPVRFNDRPYRGQIEVFANLRGALTVVNVLGLEDYVKGVVPNELSPGGFPSLEAQKAQAIAARTYALRNLGQFMSQGFDILPTTRSQVYKGLASEHALSSRAVDETRGVVATFDGKPINALYTSTCGGRTEDSQYIFTDAVGYLAARECAAEGRAMLAPFTITTTREPADLKEENLELARDFALLNMHSFGFLRPKVGDSWLEDHAELDEVRSWLSSVARLAKQAAPTVTETVHHPPAFATALSTAVFGERRGDALLNSADVQYFLAVKDANEIPESNRADVAFLIREGYMSALPDATLKPKEPLSRGRALHSIARILDARNLLQLQKATARPTADGALVLRSTRGKDQVVKVSPDAYLFRHIGERLHPVSSVLVVGGEAVTFHVNSAGLVDYLEVRPAPNGASADRSSPFANWSTALTVGQVQARLARYTGGIGSLVDVRVAARGRSRRAIDLEIIGTTKTNHVRGGRIRSALGLREQLFVVDRETDDSGRVTGFTFHGRGWGHGVGLCQVGAYGLARQGYTHEQILKAYYTGIELTRIY
ncbi:MAG TPA: SpoIID/LytB domain-containing protein [Pyrinomonadaceae bacterium]|nr:SpoIID/LytB domain-containing protein [Pyrinomonadaceae bacterium]